MKKFVLLGAVGLMSLSGVALADEASSSTTVNTGAMGTSSTTRVDKSQTNDDGTATSKTKVTHSTNSMAQPTGGESSTTVKKTTTTDN